MPDYGRLLVSTLIVDPHVSSMLITTKLDARVQSHISNMNRSELSTQPLGVMVLSLVVLEMYLLI